MGVLIEAQNLPALQARMPHRTVLAETLNGALQQVIVAGEAAKEVDASPFGSAIAVP